MLDPTKDRLRDHFSPPIVRLTFFAGQPLCHARTGRITFAINRRSILPFAPQRHQRLHAHLFQRDKGLLRAIPRIGQHSLRQLSQIVLYRFDHGQKLAVVSRIMGEPVGYNELAVGIDGGLRVVGLLKSRTHLHDPRLWIGEVILSFWLRLAEGLFERTPRAITPTLLIIRMASPLPIGFGLALLQPCLGGLYLGQTNLASSKLLRQLLLGLIHTQARVLLCIGCPSALQQRFNLLLKLYLLLFHTPVAHRFVLARIRLNLGAIQSNHPKLDHPQLFGQPHHLHKQLFKLRQMPKSKITDRFRCEGKLPAPSIRNATSSYNLLAILREEKTPVAYPYINTFTSIAGSNGWLRRPSPS